MGIDPSTSSKTKRSKCAPTRKCSLPSPETPMAPSNEMTAKSGRPFKLSTRRLSRSPSSRVKVAVSAELCQVGQPIGPGGMVTLCERQAELAVGAVERPAPAPTSTWNQPPRRRRFAGLRPRNAPASATGQQWPDPTSARGSDRLAQENPSLSRAEARAIELETLNAAPRRSRICTPAGCCRPVESRPETQKRQPPPPANKDRAIGR